MKHYLLILLLIFRSTGSNNRLVLKKDAYQVELQTPETMNLLGSTKKSTDKAKHGENLPSLELAEVVLVQCILVDNQY